VEDGWADVARCFSILKQEKPEFKILFEHQSELISDQELEVCYQWIDSLYKSK